MREGRVSPAGGASAQVLGARGKPCAGTPAEQREARGVPVERGRSTWKEILARLAPLNAEGLFSLRSKVCNNLLADS